MKNIKLLNKISSYIHGNDITLREQLLRVILLVGAMASVLALITGLLLSNSGLLSILLACITLVMGVALVLTFKFRKINAASCFLGVLILFVLFPLVFFLSGGIDSGASIWFVLGIIYVFVLFSGKQMIVFLVLAIIADIGTYVAAYLNPEYIQMLSSRQEVFYDSCVAVILVGVSSGVLMKYQSYIYEKERKISKKQREELEILSQSKDAFFANMSHEIRTPINTIIGLNEMILREDISDEIAENAINIQSASKMLLALINDILDISKIESGEMKIIPVQYETGSMFSDLVNIIWVRAHEKKLEFRVDIDSNIPSMLYGDEVRIKQVLTNILTNAVKYTSEGSVTLSAKSEMIDVNRIRLQISVSDTGMGIKKESMDDLFKSFRRVDETKNRKIEGTGLGLAITKQLVDLMGGEITVDSIYTKGSIFTVILEQQIVDPTPIGTLHLVSNKRVENREHYKQSFEAPDARVLIVDDNEMNLKVATKLLRSTKVQIDTAASGKECLEKTKQKYYHVIFMDHVMPEMDGVETLKKVQTQENGLCRDTPVIALTANALESGKEVYRNYGFQGYLTKPINGALFEATLLKYLPEDVVEYRMNLDNTGTEMEDIVKMVSNTKRRKVCITTDSLCDIPSEYLKELNISQIHYYINTEQGRFRDVKEVDADNLLKYIYEQNGKVSTSPAPVEEYETFFADALITSEEVIHLSVAPGVSTGYDNAVQAAEGFDHVHVVNSQQLSGGQAIIVMYAAQCAIDGMDTKTILENIPKVRAHISSGFLISTLDSVYQNGHVNKGLKHLCEHIGCYPTFKMINNCMKVNGFVIGRQENSWKAYVKKRFRYRDRIDKRAVMIVCAGCTVKQKELLETEIRKYVDFDNVIFKKASSTISCNSGEGSFGIFYVIKDKRGNY